MTGIVITPELEMEYFRFGNGEKTLVILPGISVKSVIGAAQLVAAAFSAFRKTHSVIVFDRKKDFGADYSVCDMAEDTARAMEELGIRNADVFGASQGGMMALVLAARYPELVHRLAIGSAMLYPNENCREIMTNWSSLARAGDVASLSRSFAERVYSDGYVEKYRAAFEMKEGDATRPELERFAVLCDACLGFDLRSEQKKPQCPTLVIGSDCDAVLSGEASRELAAYLGCGLFMYPDYSHAVYDEAPDYIGRMMRFFMDE